MIVKMGDLLSEELLNSLDIPFEFNISDVLFEFSKHNSSADNGSVSDSDKIKYEKALLNYYLMGIAGSTICCVGILCNILSVIVLTRRVMNSSTYSYLAALAVCDTLALILTVIITLLSEDIRYPQRGKIIWNRDLYAILFPYLHPAAVTFQVTSIWLTLAFTVDRYIMICHPFKAERMCSVGRARKVIVVIYILGILFNIPRFLEYKTEEFEMPSLTGGSVKHLMVVQYTDTGKSQLFMDLVHSYLYLTFVCGIPFFTLAILNTFLMHAVHMSKKNGRLINAKEKRRNDTTVMLIGVIVIFLVCQGPALISRMVYAIDFQKATESMTFHKINEVGNFLIIVNSAINIVPYYFFGKRFRREFWRLFCRCFFTKQELQKIKRNYSFSIDNRRRISQCSAASHYEMNGFNPMSDPENLKIHRDSASPLLLHLDKIHRDSVQTMETVDMNDRLSPSSFERIKRESPTSQQRSRRESPTSLRVVWEMDTNKNEKCNVMIDAVGTENTCKL